MFIATDCQADSWEFEVYHEWIIIIIVCRLAINNKTINNQFID